MFYTFDLILATLLPGLGATRLHPPEHFNELFGTDSLVLQALEIMAYGVGAVFIILSLFYLIVQGMKKLWPQ